MREIYPRPGDLQTVYLKDVVTGPNIEIGDYTMYNDFERDPRDFERNNVLYHYPLHGDTQRSGTEETIARLLALRWWEWDQETIRRAIPAIQAGRLSELEGLA